MNVYGKKYTHILDLLNSKVGVGGDPNGVWSYIDDDHDWSRNEALEQLVDLHVGRA